MTITLRRPKTTLQMLWTNDSYSADLSDPTVRRSCDLAEIAYEGLKRLTGESFIEHCLRAMILLQRLDADADLLAAAIDHDVIERFRSERRLRIYYWIAQSVGLETANLVRGVTNHSNWERRPYRAAYLLRAGQSDWRVFPLRGADRFDNLKTIQGHPLAKRLEIVIETMVWRQLWFPLWTQCVPAEGLELHQTIWESVFSLAEFELEYRLASLIPDAYQRLERGLYDGRQFLHDFRDRHPEVFL